LLSVPVGVRGLEGSVPNRVRLAIPAVPDLTIGKLLRDCIAAAADHVVSAHGGAVRTQEGFNELLTHARSDLRDVAARALKEAGAVVLAAAEVERRLDGMVSPAVEHAVADVREQL